MRTAVYIDGFNLYYWLKPLPYRWIDIKKLVVDAIAAPDFQHEIVAVKYFTARVSDTQDDPRKAMRQSVYIRALQATIPELSVYYGEFRRQPKQMPRAPANGTVGNLAWVWDTEEKGSDVNLAVELVNDAWANAFDLAIIVSNDSDLSRAVTIAKKKGHRIGILVRGDAVVNSLKQYASFSRRLTQPELARAVMPRKIPNTTIEIPTEWARKETLAGIR